MIYLFRLMQRYRHLTIFMALLILPSQGFGQQRGSNTGRTGDCPDRFLKNAFYLLGQNKIGDALETFNNIVRNFLDCPQAEEAQYQLVKFYSTQARQLKSSEFMTLAREHINFYLSYWPDGGHRGSVLKHRSYVERAEKPLKMDRTKFILLVVVSVGMTLVLGLSRGK